MTNKFRPGPTRKRVSFKNSIDNAVRAKHDKVERTRDRRGTDGSFDYACAVIMKVTGAGEHNPRRESPRNNPAAGASRNGFGRHAKKRKWLAKAHRG